MKTRHVIAIIGCVFIIAAGLIAGCTDIATPAGKITTPPVPADNTPIGGTPSAALPTVTTATLYLNSSSNGEIVTIPAGERVLVRLTENPTTGYTWNVTSSRGIDIISDTYTAPDVSLGGAPGYHEWILKPAAVDTYLFKTVYLRPWVGATSTDDTYSLVIQATKD
ncbi:MAG: protease inhibitor I42 family protein [Methanomicrobiales archaeon]